MVRLSNAKSENARLRKDVAYYRAQALANLENAQQEQQIAKLLHYREGPTFPNGYGGP